ncbi:MAG: hypothetical protein KA331_00640 [Acinetobacter sp.]|nr:hypothetical protein [Acinetobacter sp.]MBP6352309.1 hypothetical protein [Acinetobacter sp.]
MLFSILKNHVAQFNLLHKLDQFCYIMVCTTLLSIVLLAFYALHRPVNAAQYQQIQQYTQQASYPKTQHLAHNILKQQQVRRKHYFKLLNAYHFESKRVKQYPAMELKDE